MSRGIFSVNKAVKAGGSLLALAAFAVVLQKIRANWGVIVNWHPPFAVGWIIFIGALAYAAASQLLAGAWIRLLAYFGQTDVGRNLAASIYARTQLAKYLPGNVFHLASRHVLSKQAGSGHGGTAGAAVFEAIGLIGSACAVSLLGLVFESSSIGGSRAFWYIGVLCWAVGFPLLANHLLGRVRVLKKMELPVRKPAVLLRSLLPIYSLYGLFFLVSGGILLWLVSLTGAVERVQTAGTVMTVYAASWVAGFVTPGAPAGLGVREALITLSLTGTIGESNSLLVALIFRMITVGGDLLFFLSSFLGRRQ
jgi:glycosyltransferase 2 family protein